MTLSRLSILGVSFDRPTLEEAMQRLDRDLKSQQQHFWVTPNPEICLEAENNAPFRQALTKADFSIPDGFGILWAGRFLGGKGGFFRWLWTLLTPHLTRRHSPFPERVTGTDVMQEACRRFPKRSVFLLGAADSVNARLADQLKQQGVNVVGHYAGDPSKKLEPIIVKMIKAAEPELLYVAFGAPQQELWIDRNLAQLTSVHVAIGVGGAFDFLAGKRRRAPSWMRSSGLEWLFRLLIEPRRLKRIFRATIIFPWHVLQASRKA